MQKFYFRIMNFAILSILFPFVYGCGGGGGSALGGAFTGGGSSGVSGASLSSSGFVGGGGAVVTSSGIISGGSTGGGTIAALHNPEPMTMALFGGGMLAMAALKNRKKK